MMIMMINKEWSEIVKIKWMSGRNFEMIVISFSFWVENRLNCLANNIAFAMIEWADFPEPINHQPLTIDRWPMAIVVLVIIATKRLKTPVTPKLTTIIMIIKIMKLVIIGGTSWIPLLFKPPPVYSLRHTVIHSIVIHFPINPSWSIIHSLLAASINPLLHSS